MGSYAKPWTAAAIVRLAEQVNCNREKHHAIVKKLIAPIFFAIQQGNFSLDDPFVPLIDPYLKQINETTMGNSHTCPFLTKSKMMHAYIYGKSICATAQLGWNATINLVTVRQVCVC